MGSYVRELCLALAHKWEPRRLFVILTAYLDESGTHGEASPVTIMGGVMATAKKWAKFEAAFEQAKRRHGFKVFHTKKFKKRRGDFAGWTDAQCLGLIGDLAPITAKAFTESVVFTLENASYETEYKAAERPRRVRLDSKYGLCFRECMYYFLRELLRRSREDRPRKLHFVLESGHANAGDAARIHAEVRDELKARGYDILGDLTFSDKSDCNPLMIADLVAHTQFMRELGQTKPDQPSTGAKPKSGIMRLKYKPGGLAELPWRLAKWRRPQRKV